MTFYKEIEYTMNEVALMVRNEGIQEGIKEGIQTGIKERMKIQKGIQIGEKKSNLYLVYVMFYNK